ncbi:YdcF family protein [Candidatus Bealeia paramacronuclearis]|uniref:YdcF family protein n=3 Tax=Candidatus Bealeia paramacronuclearis TaxID=1921001 RepID=A0ABZ2C2T9_9PROT|nr:YdcF family protein [Candidatus Bealeia paramacronuclearis]
MILRGLFFGIRLGFIMASLAVLWVLGLIIFTQRIPMAPQDFTTKTGGIVVFTGGNARLKEGFLLLEQGMAPRLLISGVNPDATLMDLTKAANIKPSFSKNQVTLGFHAEDTIENAKEAADWANKYHMNSLRLVTSNYHMPRSLLEIHQELPHVHIIPHPVVADAFKHKKWWADQKTILNVIREYNKYLFALGRYTITTLERML